MVKRISLVDNVHVISASLGSIIEIGDSIQITPRTRALAVQREAELFYADEGNFDAFPMFSKPIPQLKTRESLKIRRFNDSRFIKVSNIDITGIAAASVLHIGSTKQIDSEARVKHIRQLLKSRRNINDEN